MLAILVMAYLQIRKEMAPLSGALSGEVSLVDAHVIPVL
jgi:hypothetical protein